MLGWKFLFEVIKISSVLVVILFWFVIDGGNWVIWVKFIVV